MNPLDAVTETVAALEAALPGLLEACTDPQAADMAELLLVIREARTKLHGLEADAEGKVAKAMLSDQAVTGVLRFERYRAADRKEWEHERWQADVRAKVIQARGLKGAQGVLTADGEVLGPEVLYDLMASVESVHAAGAPKTGKASGLRAFGLDPDDYCKTTKGDWHVRVYRMAEEGGENDAA